MVEKGLVVEWVGKGGVMFVEEGWEGGEGGEVVFSGEGIGGRVGKEGEEGKEVRVEGRWGVVRKVEKEGGGMGEMVRG